MTVSIANRSCSPTVHIPYARIKNDKALAWIYESLESHSLSEKLKCLLTDSEHINTCYEVTAFLQSEKYVGAFLLCLNAIENNQPNLLSQIDVTLYKSEKSQHKRSTSHPDFSFVPRTKGNLKTPINSITNTRTVDFQHRKSALSHSNSVTDGSSTVRKGVAKPPTKDIQLICLKLRPWSSLPDVHSNIQPQRKRSTTMSQPIHIPNIRSKNTSMSGAIRKVPSFTYKQNASESGSAERNNCNSLATPSPSEGSSQMSNELQPISLLKCDDIKIHVDRKFRPKTQRKKSSPPKSEDFSYSSNDEQSHGGCFIGNRNLLSIMIHPDKPESLTSYSGFGGPGSAPADFVNAFIPREGEKIQNRYGKPSMADFDQDCSPIGSQTRPKQGQSLTSFLQAAQFYRANTELERENAHFSVSEAMISAIEQIKWQRFQETEHHSIGDAETIRQRVKNHGQYTHNTNGTKAKSVESGSPSSSDESSGDLRYSANDSTVNLAQCQVILNLNYFFLPVTAICADGF